MSSATSLTLSRSFQILECFERSRRPLRAADLQEEVSCPKSSLNVILKGMVELGYLHYDRRSRSYFPSLKVQFFGDWILSTVTRGPHLQRVARQLRNKVDETVVISVKVSNYLEVAVVETSSKPISLQLPIGTRFGLWNTAVGIAFLMSQSNTEIKRLHQIDQRSSTEPPPALSEVMEHVAQGRAVGCAIAYGSVVPDLGALAAPLKLEASHPAIVLSVGGPIARVKEQEAYLADRLRSACHIQDNNIYSA